MHWCSLHVCLSLILEFLLKTGRLGRLENPERLGFSENHRDRKFNLSPRRDSVTQQKSPCPEMGRFNLVPKMTHSTFHPKDVYIFFEKAMGSEFQVLGFELRKTKLGIRTPLVSNKLGIRTFSAIQNPENTVHST
jgi:hypothetical protein